MWLVDGDERSTQQDACNRTTHHAVTSIQAKRLERRYASLASAQAGGGADSVTREAFCRQPEASRRRVNVPVGIGGGILS